MSLEAVAVDLGSLRLANPLVLASGVQGGSLLKAVEAIKQGAGGAVTKSVGPVPREGYAEPTMVEVRGGMVNAVGLPNPGPDMFAEELGRLRGEALPIFVSVFGGDDSEFARVVKIVDGNDFIAYELNLSCPHVEGVGTEVGHDPELVGKVVKAVKRNTEKPVFAKLSPNTDRLLEVARAAVDAGVDGLTAVNTLKAFPIDVETGKPALSNGYGGLSGPALHPVALRCVYELRETFDLPIIGCGGVTGWEDAARFMLAGADAVQVGTATLGRPGVFNDINIGLVEYIERKGIPDLRRLVGGAHKRGHPGEG